MDSNLQKLPRGRPRQFEYATKEEYNRQYYLFNKEKWNGDFVCPCGMVCSLVNKNRHLQSKYHLKKMESQ